MQPTWFDGTPAEALDAVGAIGPDERHDVDGADAVRRPDRRRLL